MATIYYADNYGEPQVDDNAGGLIFPFKYTLSVAFVLNDQIYLASLAQANMTGYVLHDFIIDVPDLDSSTGIVLAVGDSTSATLFASSLATGQAGGRISSFDSTVGVATGVLSRKYTAADNLILKVTTAATGTAATTGTISGRVYYSRMGLFGGCVN